MNTKHDTIRRILTIARALTLIPACILAILHLINRLQGRKDNLDGAITTLALTGIGIEAANTVNTLIEHHSTPTDDESDDTDVEEWDWDNALCDDDHDEPYSDDPDFARRPIL